MNQKKSLNKIRNRRARRTAIRVREGGGRPRHAVFRSNKAIYAQLIDDAKGVTIVSASSRDVKKEKTMKKTEMAQRVGELIAERAVKAGITQAVFDRRSYEYHGRVASVAEGARKAGLKI